MVIARRFPEDAAIGPAQGNEIGVAVVIAIEDDFILVEKKAEIRRRQRRTATG